MKTALVVGATGLIGNHLVKLLSEDSEFQRIIVLSRRELPLPAKCRNVVVDFDSLTNYYEQIKADVVFCCLGTTIKVARTKEAFRKVDYDYPLEVAKLAKANGAVAYVLVSALGAKKESSVFYNKVKGEIEESIQQLNYDQLHIVRPSLLLGDRKEYRSGEDAAKVFFKIFGFLIPSNYKAIESIKVAKAMIHFAKQGEKGVFIHESAELQKF